MKWKLYPKVAIEFINAAKLIVLAVWGMFIIAIVAMNNTVSSLIDKRLDEKLSTIYRTETEVNATSITFQEFQRAKKDSIQATIVDRVEERSMPLYVIYKMFDGVRNTLTSIFLLLLVTFGIIILLEAIKNTYYLRDRLDFLNTKVDFMFIQLNKQTKHLRPINNEEDELLDS